MKDWIPLLQTLVWPIFISILIYFNKGHAKELLAIAKERIKDGGEFGIGPQGLTLGAVPKLSDSSAEEDVIDDETSEVENLKFLKEDETPDKEEGESSIPEFQLTHRTSYWKMKNGRRYYRVFVALEAKDSSAYLEVEKVIYYLHKTFKNPIREIIDPDSNFALQTAAWGEFTLRAEVFLTEVVEPIKLSRYISIQ